MHLSGYLTESGKTIDQAASELNVTPMAIRHWLSGRSIPRRATAQKIESWSGGKVTYADLVSPAPTQAAQ